MSADNNSKKKGKNRSYNLKLGLKSTNQDFEYIKLQYKYIILVSHQLMKYVECRTVKNIFSNLLGAKWLLAIKSARFARISRNVLVAVGTSFSNAIERN